MFESRFVCPAPTGVIEPVSVPSFSILIPVYQAAATVGGAVASALSQTRPTEVIVCDDGSTDDLDHALAPYRDRIQLLRKPNGGGASALNVAARAATGEFVAILDADDTYDNRRIEALGELAAARPDLDIVTTDAYLETGGKITGTFNGTTPFAVEDQRVAITRTCFVGGWPAVRRTRLLAANGWDETFRIGYDWDCWLRLIFDGARAGLVDEPLMTYRLHAGVTADRAETLRARVRLLAQAKQHASLTPREQRLLRASVRWQRSRLLREIAETSGSQGRANRSTVRLARGRELLARVRFDTSVK